MNISASGIISSAGFLSRNGDPITIDVDGTLTHNGQIKTNGTTANNSAGGSAADVTIIATTIAGTGSFNLSGQMAPMVLQTISMAKMEEMVRIFLLPQVMRVLTFQLMLMVDQAIYTQAQV